MRIGSTGGATEAGCGPAGPGGLGAPPTRHHPEPTRTRALADRVWTALRALRLFPAACALLALAWLVPCGQTMPSYDDVLLVVKQGDSDSAAVAAYFQAQRQIPQRNVLTVSLTGTVPTVEARDTFVQAIRNHIVQNGLQGQINYIVLSSNFPRECKDTTNSAYNAILDCYLMWALSDTYPATTVQDCVPLRRNPYYFLRTPNYDTRSNIKFTRSRYGFYLISRLDGEGTAVTKQLIDNSGAPAYDQYQQGINFLADQSPASWATYGSSLRRVEFKDRGVNLLDWDSAVSGSAHNVHGLNFAFFDWLVGPSDAYQSYRNITKHIRFRPGGVVYAYRSYPAVVFKRPLAGLSSYTLSNGTVKSFMQSDASDLALRQMADVAYVTEDSTLWCALAQDPLRIYSTPNPTSANHYRGNGVAVYTATGTLTHHFTVENTSGGLLSDAVYRVSYDPFNHKVWVGTFRGVCAYNLNTDSWERPAGLNSDRPAPVRQIYVDPTTDGRFLYVNFSAGATGVTPDITSYRSVLEYEVSTATIRTFRFHGDDMDNASVTKTDPTTLWAVYSRPTNGGQAMVSKYSTASLQLLNSLDLSNLGGTNYKPSETGASFNYQITSAHTGESTDSVFVTVRSESTSFNGVLRIQDAGGQLDTAVWGHVSSYGTDKKPARLLASTTSPGTVYCLMTARYDTDANARIYRFSSTETAGTALLSGGGSSPVTGGIGALALHPDGTTLYYIQSLTGASHEPVVDFFPSGAIAGVGGNGHNVYSYAGITDTSLTPYLDDIISPTLSPDHARDADLYKAIGAYPTDAAGALSLHLLNGFYLGEARLGTLPAYPPGVGGGGTGHMLIFDPKACPFAPRVDESRTLLEVTDRRTLRVRMFSPGFPQTWANLKSREGGFIASTISADTVTLADAQGSPLALESVAYNEYEEAGRLVCEIAARANADLTPGTTVRLTLRCGAAGIKNSKGASLVNTRSTEFKDEISLAYSVVPQSGAAPVILQQPAHQTVNEGQSATFSVCATGAGPMNYQWHRNSQAIAGATGSTYVTPPTCGSDAGALYTVQVFNADGTLTSEAASLTVQNACPTLATYPQPKVVLQGQTATFSVSAQGTPPLQYQWYKNATRIAGATSATYTTPATVATDHGALFSVVVTSALGAVASPGAVLTVIAVPAVTTQPAAATILENNRATFSVTATGGTPDAPLACQWRKNGVDIPGANSLSYTTPPVTIADNNSLFSVVLTNAKGSTTSSGGRLTVLQPPSVTISPPSLTVHEGDSGSFHAVTSILSPFRFQWQRNFVPIAGATNQTYTTPPVTWADNASLFRVTISNAVGVGYSGTAVLYVNRRPSLTVTHPPAAALEGQPTSASGTFADPDGTTNLTVVADLGSVAKDDATGVWTWSYTPVDGPASHTVTITATDQHSASVSVSFPLEVGNLAPTALPQALEVDEDSALNLTLTGCDPGQDDLTLAVSTPPTHGSLSGTPPHLVYLPQPDWHGTDTFAFHATDSDGATSADAAVTITVRPVNDTPTGIALSPATIEENEPAGTVVGGFTTTDPDGGNSIVYTLVPGAGDTGNASFAIEGTALVAQAPFDYEQATGQSIRIRATDAGGLWTEQSFQIAIANVADAHVVGRHIFYNQSWWDGKDAAANAADDGAIAPDKTALLPGQKASFANYTSYSRGINGIMIDVDGLSATPTAADFTFKVGNSNDPATWTAAPAPSSIAVRPGAGVGGSHRITVLWPNWTTSGVGIGKTWLQVTLLATAQTDLPRQDVFYFGSAVGETGDSVNNAVVNATDDYLIRVNPRPPSNPATITDRYDIDRTRFVDAIDAYTARVNATSPVTALRLISVPQESAAPAGISPNGSRAAGLASVDQADADAATDAAPGEAGAMEPATTPEPTPFAMRVAAKTGRTYRLQASSQVTGPWHDVLPDAITPDEAADIVGQHMRTQDARQQFFRLLQNDAGKPEALQP